MTQQFMSFPITSPNTFPKYKINNAMVLDEIDV